MIPRTTSSRWLAGATLLVALLIVFSVVVGALNRDHEPELLPAGSPGRTVQDYVLATQRNDGPAAYAVLSEEARERCGPDSSPSDFHFRDGSFSIRLVREEAGEDEALVTIEITRVNAPGEFPLLGSAVDEFEATYRLIREQDEWRLRNTGWPGWRCPPKTPLPPPVVATGEP